MSGHWKSCYHFVRLRREADSMFHGLAIQHPIFQTEYSVIEEIREMEMKQFGLTLYSQLNDSQRISITEY